MSRMHSKNPGKNHGNLRLSRVMQRRRFGFGGLALLLRTGLRRVMNLKRHEQALELDTVMSKPWSWTQLGRSYSGLMVTIALAVGAVILVMISVFAPGGPPGQRGRVPGLRRGVRSF